MTENVFRSQLAFLRDRFHVLTAHEAYKSLQRGVLPADRPCVAITFDDGYVDNLRIAAKHLGELGLTATFYVVTGLIGTDGELWYDEAVRRLRGCPRETVRRVLVELGANLSAPSLERAWIDALKRLPHYERCRAIPRLEFTDQTPPRRELDRMMTLAELRELASSGHEIGAHTVDHPLLDQLTLDEQLEQIAGSREWLIEHMGTTPTGFSYPNGNYVAETVRLVREVGYTYAVTTQMGMARANSPSLELPRLDMNPRNVTRGNLQHDPHALLAEISLLHARLRRVSKLIGRTQ
jgi:peptidoglycan/xylan/chitin deacetylase (PgdA/CDA1 family)